MLQLDDEVRSQEGDREARVGGLVCYSDDNRLHVIVPAFVLPGRITTGAGDISLRDAVGDRGYDSALGDYRSVTYALTFATVPERVEIDDRASDWSHKGVAAVGNLVGGRVKMGEGVWGRVRLIDSPLWLARGEEPPKGFYGAMEIVPERKAGRWVSSRDAGSPLFTEDDLLVGFIVAADETTCMVAPAERFFAERKAVMASASEITLHNEAIRNRPLRQVGTMLADLSAFGAKIARSSATFGRAAEAAR